MNRRELAIEIFLKRMPFESLNDQNAGWFRAKVDEAFALAAMFEMRSGELVNEAMLAHLDITDGKMEVGEE